MSTSIIGTILTLLKADATGFTEPVHKARASLREFNADVKSVGGVPVAPFISMAAAIMAVRASLSAMRGVVAANAGDWKGFDEAMKALPLHLGTVYGSIRELLDMIYHIDEETRRWTADLALMKAGLAEVKASSDIWHKVQMVNLAGFDAEREKLHQEAAAMRESARAIQERTKAAEDASREASKGAFGNRGTLLEATARGAGIFVNPLGAIWGVGHAFLGRSRVAQEPGLGIAGGTDIMAGAREFERKSLLAIEERERMAGHETEHKTWQDRQGVVEGLRSTYEGLALTERELLNVEMNRKMLSDDQMADALRYQDLIEDRRQAEADLTATLAGQQFEYELREQAFEEDLRSAQTFDEEKKQLLARRAEILANPEALERLNVGQGAAVSDRLKLMGLAGDSPALVVSRSQLKELQSIDAKLDKLLGQGGLG